MASGLKECMSCHNILRSVCTKTSCKQNGERPVMIMAAVASSSRVRLGNRFDESSDEEEINDTESEEMSVSDECSEDDSQQTDIIQNMQQAFISPPNKEEAFIEKWFGVCYSGKRTESI